MEPEPLMDEGYRTYVRYASPIFALGLNPLWGLTIAALAVVGGMTHALGNRLLLPLGLFGGLAFALATATIAFVDTFDPLFPVAGLAGIWLVTTGVVGLTCRPAS